MQYDATGAKIYIFQWHVDGGVASFLDYFFCAFFY